MRQHHKVGARPRIQWRCRKQSKVSHRRRQKHESVTYGPSRTGAAKSETKAFRLLVRYSEVSRMRVDWMDGKVDSGWI